jgi:2'-5' RNA ligase
MINSDSLHCKRLHTFYDRMWTASIGKIRAGETELDRVLESGLPDARRGLSVIARPSAFVRRRVAAFLGELRRLEPGQHYYAPAQLHITVLSLFAATTEHEPYFTRIGEYIAVVDAALRESKPFRIEFSGITASPGAIMIQGFFSDDSLNNFRNALRRGLKISGLADEVDERYRLATAHMTVARFSAPLRNSERFANKLEDARQLEFGQVDVRSVSLVKHDWYLSWQNFEMVKRYRLPAGGS